MRYAVPVPGTVESFLPDREPFPCLIQGWWNGFAEPLFDRAGVERLIAEQAEMNAELEEGERALLSWEGDVLVVFNEIYADEGEAATDRIEPWEIDGQQRWSVGLGWTWSGATLDDDPLRPTREQLDARRAQLAHWGQAMSRQPTQALPDGSHRFPLFGPVVEENGMRTMSAVAYVDIAQDGTVTTTAL